MPDNFAITAVDYWEDLGLFAAFALSLFVLMGLGLRLRETRTPRMHLWAMVGFFGINALDVLESLVFGAPFSAPMAFYRWQDLLIPGFMVTLYFFVRGLTASDPRLTRRDLVHLAPFGAALLCLAPTLIVPGTLREAPNIAGLSPWHLRLVETGETAFWVLWIIVLAVYGTLCVRQLMAHKRNIRDVFSDLEGKTLAWLDMLVGVIFFLAGVVILDEVLILMDYPEIRNGFVSMVFDLLLAGSFGVFALRATPPLPGWSSDVLTPAEDAPPPDAPVAARYARSGLQAADLDRYAARLEKRMSEGQLWRDHGLNLRGLAAEISIPSIHLSEVLNTRLSMSFYDYVNQWRVRDACELLAGSDQTILEISETVGFNAKSTFNTSFKKVTEQTPSQWRMKHRRK
ncbi:MAG: helix-turn-helix transcriptional regulator [Silicimonas sp.]|nr:helix-turn-helix transcriptional regulator [Silicimonas sp.]